MPGVQEVSVRASVRRYPLTKKTCPVCKEPFEGNRLAVYCSDTCRQRAEWERRAEKVNEKRRQQRAAKWEGQP